MNQERKEKWQARWDAEKSAMMLLEDYVKTHSKEFANALKNFIPFFEECSADGLERVMSDINTTIATIALEVIEDRNNKEEDDPDRRMLPCGAYDLKCAVYYMTWFVSLLQPLGDLLDKLEVPAISMCRKAFFKYKARG